MKYPDDIRRVIYTTNAIESINHAFRKIFKSRGAFPTEQAVFKVMYMALQNIAKQWTIFIRNWKAVLNRFAIMFEGRLPYTRKVVYTKNLIHSLKLGG